VPAESAGLVGRFDFGGPSPPRPPRCVWFLTRLGCVRHVVVGRFLPCWVSLDIFQFATDPGCSAALSGRIAGRARSLALHPWPDACRQGLPAGSARRGLSARLPALACPRRCPDVSRSPRAARVRRACLEQAATGPSRGRLVGACRTCLVLALAVVAPACFRLVLGASCAVLASVVFVCECSVAFHFVGPGFSGVFLQVVWTFGCGRAGGLCLSGSGFVAGFRDSWLW